MVKFRVILLILFLAPMLSWAQDYSIVGMTKEEVQKEIEKNYRKFSRDNSIVKQQFNYLKYVNGSQTITWIFYFSEKDICTSTKKVCDYAEYDFILEDLDDRYEKVDEQQWSYQADDRTFTITMEEKDWYFTIREKEKEKR